MAEKPKKKLPDGTLVDVDILAAEATKAEKDINGKPLAGRIVSVGSVMNADGYDDILFYFENGEKLVVSVANVMSSTYSVRSNMATNADNDSSGRNIINTYSTKMDLSDKVEELNQKLKNKVEELNQKLKNTDNSVSQIEDKYNTIVNATPEVLDVFNELVDYLETDESGVVDLINTVDDNRQNISQVRQDLDDYTNGTYAVQKAIKDENGNVIHETYETKSNAQNYLVADDINHLATKSEISVLASKNELINYATKEEVNEVIYELNDKEYNLKAMINGRLSTSTGGVVKGHTAFENGITTDTLTSSKKENGRVLAYNPDTNTWHYDMYKYSGQYDSNSEIVTKLQISNLATKEELYKRPKCTIKNFDTGGFEEKYNLVSYVTEGGLVHAGINFNNDTTYFPEFTEYNKFRFIKLKATCHATLDSTPNPELEIVIPACPHTQYITTTFINSKGIISYLRFMIAICVESSSIYIKDYILINPTTDAQITRPDNGIYLNSITLC